MVATRFDFNPPDVTVPHGGPPFHGWKKGWGFGQSKGPGGFVHDVSIPAKLRCSPDGDRGFASSPFWRSRLEVGKASSFGIGPRPDYGLEHKDSVPPDTYGDVSKKVDAVRATAVRKGITVKSKFPSMEERYRDMSWPQCGPGPAKYDTSYACGQSSWTSPAKLPAYTMGVRKVFDQELIYRMREPGPDEYHTRGHPGRNSQIKRGTLYDISMKGRLPFKGAGLQVLGLQSTMCAANSMSTGCGRRFRTSSQLASIVPRQAGAKRLMLQSLSPPVLVHFLVPQQACRTLLAVARKRQLTMPAAIQAKG